MTNPDNDSLHDGAERIAVPQFDLVGSPVDSPSERLKVAEEHHRPDNDDEEDDA